MPGRSPILCYVTDRQSLPAASSFAMREALLRRVELAGEASLDWIQIREKDLSGRECSELTRDALHRLSLTAGARTSRIIVNDRLDVALAERASGVHLGENSLPVLEAKKFWDSRAGSKDRFAHSFSVGVSCHSLESAKSAASSGADYIFFGPLFATPSKAAYGSPQGLERLAEVCRAVSIPVLAIGGITLDNAAGCLASGAAGIAAIRLFQDAPDLPRLVQTLRQL